MALAQIFKVQSSGVTFKCAVFSKSLFSIYSGNFSNRQKFCKCTFGTVFTNVFCTHRIMINLSGLVYVSLQKIPVWSNSILLFFVKRNWAKEVFMRKLQTVLWFEQTYLITFARREWKLNLEVRTLLRSFK